MSITFFPAGLEIDVRNPGYGEIYIAAPRNPYRGERLLPESEWSTVLLGPAIGTFLQEVTTRALASPEGRADDDPGDETLPSFITTPVARQLLPHLQQAVVLATAGSDRFDRIFPEDDRPQRPLCAYCHEGSMSTSAKTISPWCTEHGHQAFGIDTDTTWGLAQVNYKHEREQWDRRKRVDGDNPAISFDVDEPPQPIVIPRGGLGDFLREQAAGRREQTLADLLHKARLVRGQAPGSMWPAWSTGELLSVAYILCDWDRLEGMDYTADDALTRIQHDLGMTSLDEAREALEQLRSQL